MEQPGGCVEVGAAALSLLDGLRGGAAAAVAINCTAGLRRSVYGALVLHNQLSFVDLDAQLWFPAVVAEKANKQTQTSKQTNKQTNKKAHKQANKQQSKQTHNMALAGCQSWT